MDVENYRWITLILKEKCDDSHASSWFLSSYTGSKNVCMPPRRDVPHSLKTEQALLYSKTFSRAKSKMHYCSRCSWLPLFSWNRVFFFYMLIILISQYCDLLISEWYTLLCFCATDPYKAFEGLQAEECGILNGCENGRCVRVQEGYTCDCFDGYTLDLSRMACIGERAVTHKT